MFPKYDRRWNAERGTVKVDTISFDNTEFRVVKFQTFMKVSKKLSKCQKNRTESDVNDKIPEHIWKF